MRLFLTSLTLSPFERDEIASLIHESEEMNSRTPVKEAHSVLVSPLALAHDHMTPDP